MTQPLFVIQSTEEGGRHRASLWLGLKLGLASLVVALGPIATLIFLWFYIGSGQSTLSGTTALAVLGLLAAAFLSPGIAIVLGVLALRRNRMLGKVFAVIGILCALVTIGYFVVAQFTNAGYL